MTLWLVCRRTSAGMNPWRERIDLGREPCRTVKVVGLGAGDYWIEEDGRPMTPRAAEKPPCRVPSMAEVAAVPWNGFTVASTFSGCGGSCLGYRMAGFRQVDCLRRWTNFAAWLAVKEG
jgi:hypothetical protein